MQIQLKQKEIEAALRGYILKMGIRLQGRTLDITFVAGRKENGLTADLVIEDAPIPGYGPQDPQDYEDPDLDPQPDDYGEPLPTPDAGVTPEQVVPPADLKETTPEALSELQTEPPADTEPEVPEDVQEPIAQPLPPVVTNLFAAVHIAEPDTAEEPPFDADEPQVQVPKTWSLFS